MPCLDSRSHFKRCFSWFFYPGCVFHVYNPNHCNLNLKHVFFLYTPRSTSMLVYICFRIWQLRFLRFRPIIFLVTSIFKSYFEEIFIKDYTWKLIALTLILCSRSLSPPHYLSYCSWFFVWSYHAFGVQRFKFRLQAENQLPRVWNGHGSRSCICSEIKHNQYVNHFFVG